MTARFPAAVAKPEIVRLSDIEGQVIVVIPAATDEDLKAFGHAC
jgi:hypothetical protein